MRLTQYHNLIVSSTTLMLQQKQHCDSSVTRLPGPGLSQCLSIRRPPPLDSQRVETTRKWRFYSRDEGLILWLPDGKNTKGGTNTAARLNNEGSGPPTVVCQKAWRFGCCVEEADSSQSPWTQRQTCSSFISQELVQKDMNPLLEPPGFRFQASPTGVWNQVRPAVRSSSTPSRGKLSLVDSAWGSIQCETARDAVSTNIWPHIEGMMHYGNIRRWGLQTEIFFNDLRTTNNSIHLHFIEPNQNRSS